MPEVSDEQLREAVIALAEFGSKKRAAEMMGIPRSTLQHRILMAETKGIEAISEPQSVQFPSFVTEGDEEEPIEELLGRLKKHQERKRKETESRNWFPIQVKEDKPYGILWFGDPHLGPDTDWALLESHIGIARQDGVYGGNIGDTTDNFPWTGRLARIWAEKDVSEKTERRLAKWFMMEAGIKWMVWLLGNHDEWNSGTEFYKMLGAHRVPVIDWRAQFTLCHKNGSQTRIDAAHGRKGNSIYNPTHGTLRAAKFGEDAQLYVTGHIHCYGLFDIEFPEKKHRAWLAQISGYKTNDRYALVKGFEESKHGAAVLSIINPVTGGIQCFGDAEEGADYLQFLRNR